MRNGTKRSIEVTRSLAHTPNFILILYALHWSRVLLWFTVTILKLIVWSGLFFHPVAEVRIINDDTKGTFIFNNLQLLTKGTQYFSACCGLCNSKYQSIGNSEKLLSLVRVRYLSFFNSASHVHELSGRTLRGTCRGEAQEQKRICRGARLCGGEPEEGRGGDAAR